MSYDKDKALEFSIKTLKWILQEKIEPNTFDYVNVLKAILLCKSALGDDYDSQS